MLYQISNGAVAFGDDVILHSIDFEIRNTEKIAIVGRNGCGKTTLLKLISGEVEMEKLDSDESAFIAKAGNPEIGYLKQIAFDDPDVTLEQEVRKCFVKMDERKAELARAAAELEHDYSDEKVARYTAMEEAFKDDGGYYYEKEYEVMIRKFGFSDDERKKPIRDFSGGQQTKIAFIKLLLSKPDILLLDEPTNHLDAESVAWLENHLKEYKGTVVMVTHDRYFLDNVTGWILELDRGQGIPYEGNYSSWLEQKQKRLEQEAREETARQKTLANELEWIHKNPKARQAKSKARINAYDELLNAATKDKITQAHINIPMTDRLGDLVIEANNISKGYGDRLLIDNLSFKIPKGAIVGIIGPNGAGKTTLFRMITGQEKPDAGEIRIGETVDLGYVDQSRDELDPNKNVWEEISDGLDMIQLGKKEMPSRAYVGQFNFKGGDQQKKVGQLSGGERNRVHLAKMLKKGANVILLDEPTNDLDVDTLRSLEEGIMEYPGCVLVTSHDRWFLDRLATHILAYEGDSQVVWFEGNFEEYEKDKKRRLGDDALVPHAIKYRKLTR